MSNTESNPLSKCEAWNNVAGSYGDMADWVMTPFAKKATSFVSIDENSNILDVACGTGILACMLAESVSKVYAVDFSADMLTQLKNKLCEQDLHNVELVHGDGQNLSYKDFCFDHAFSLFGLMFFPNRIKGFRELHRVLKSGGTAIVSSWAPINRSTLMQAVSTAIKSVLPDAPSPRAHSNTLENPELFKYEMEAAGFQSVVIHEVTLELPEITPELFWTLMSEGGAPIALLKKKLPANEWEEMSKKIINHLHSTYTQGTMKLSTTSYFGVGRKK